jgi:hypothetical protein
MASISYISPTEQDISLAYKYGAAVIEPKQSKFFSLELIGLEVRKSLSPPKHGHNETKTSRQEEISGLR